MAKKRNSKTAAELKAEISFLRRERQGGATASVLNNLIKWAGLVLIAYFIYLSVRSLAGQTTAADIGIELLADVQLSDVFGLIFGAGGVTYGFRQRSLRRSTVKRLQDRNRRFEESRDPNRSSSGLTETGETHPMDT